MDLSVRESTILAAARKGEQIDLRGAEIPAASLRELLTKADSLGLHPRGLYLRGAHITGTLDLEAAFLPRPLRFRDCTFDEPVWLRHASGETIRLSDCRLPGLDATRLHLRGDLQLDNGFTSQGRVRLRGAVIRGDLYAKGGHFTNHDGPALTAEDITVEGGVWLSGDETSCFEATGEVRLIGAVIRGQLRCTGGRFINPRGHALHAERIMVGGGVFLTGVGTARFEAAGEVCFRAATIHGPFNCLGGRFANPDGRALVAQGITVHGRLDLAGAENARFEAVGEVNLGGATIHGQLQCGGGQFSNPGGRALSATGMRVTQRVSWRPAETPVGRISFAHARIGPLFDDERTWSKADLDLPGVPQFGFGYRHAIGRTGWSARGRAWDSR